MASFVNNFMSDSSSALFAVIKAIIIFILAYIVAGVVKKLVLKLISHTKLKELFAKLGGSSDPEGKGVIDFVGKLVYLLVFLLFVPGIFECLGMTSISTPVLNVLGSIWGYVPNILAAVIIIVVGSMVAKLVRQLLIPIFDKLNINKLQEKAGIEVNEAGKLSPTLAYIVYVLILIPVIIMALQALNIESISAPAIAMLNKIFDFIPNIFVAIVIILIGIMVSKFIGQIVRSMIQASGLDKKFAGIFTSENKTPDLSKIVGTTIQVVLIVFFVVESFSVLQLAVLSNIGNTVIAYMPKALAAILILAACFIAASLASTGLEKTGAASYAMPARVTIIVIGAFLALNQLQIAKDLVNAAFIILLAGGAIAAAIAFGVGGRDFAREILSNIKFKKNKNQ